MYITTHFKQTMAALVIKCQNIDLFADTVGHSREVVDMEKRLAVLNAGQKGYHFSKMLYSNFSAGSVLFPVDICCGVTWNSTSSPRCTTSTPLLGRRWPPLGALCRGVVHLS